MGLVNRWVEAQTESLDGARFRVRAATSVGHEYIVAAARLVPFQAVVARTYAVVVAAWAASSVATGISIVMWGFWAVPLMLLPPVIGTVYQVLAVRRAAPDAQINSPWGALTRTVRPKIEKMSLSSICVNVLFDVGLLALSVWILRVSERRASERLFDWAFVIASAALVGFGVLSGWWVVSARLRDGRQH